MARQVQVFCPEVSLALENERLYGTKDVELVRHILMPMQYEQLAEFQKCQTNEAVLVWLSQWHELPPVLPFHPINFPVRPSGTIARMYDHKTRTGIVMHRALIVGELKPEHYAFFSVNNSPWEMCQPITKAQRLALISEDHHFDVDGEVFRDLCRS